MIEFNHKTLQELDKKIKAVRELISCRCPIDCDDPVSVFELNPDYAYALQNGVLIEGDLLAKIGGIDKTVFKKKISYEYLNSSYSPLAKRFYTENYRVLYLSIDRDNICSYYKLVTKTLHDAEQALLRPSINNLSVADRANIEFILDLDLDYYEKQLRLITKNDVNKAFQAAEDEIEQKNKELEEEVERLNKEQMDEIEEMRMESENNLNKVEDYSQEVQSTWESVNSDKEKTYIKPELIALSVFLTVFGLALISFGVL